MSNVLFTKKDVINALAVGIVAFSLDGRHAFYTSNREVIENLSGEFAESAEDHFDDSVESDIVAYNLLTKRMEPIRVASFMGVVSQVAFATQVKEIQENSDEVVGIDTALILGEYTGVISATEKVFSEQSNALKESIKDSYDDLLVLPSFVTFTKYKEQLTIDAIYLLKR